MTTTTAERPVADTQRLTAAIARAVIPALHEIGERETAAIKESVAIPIEYGKGPPIRSVGGEPPRRGVKTHPLLDSIEYGVDADAQMPYMMIVAGEGCTDKHGSNYAADLEIGRGKDGPRPFMHPGAIRMQEYAAEVVARHLKQALS